MGRLIKLRISQGKLININLLERQLSWKKVNTKTIMKFPSRSKTYFKGGADL
jgi:hypothetical protein